MQGTHKEAVDFKLKELQADLKIDTSDPEWQKTIHEKLRNTRIEHRIYLAISLIILVSSSVLMFCTLFYEGKTWYGIELNRQLFFLLFIVNLSALVFTMVGSLRLRKYKLKTIIFLNELGNE
jgi:hypothetical protein